MCARTGCNVAAVCRPVLIVGIPRHPGKPIRCQMALGLCDEHRAEATIERLLTDGMWEAISNGIASKIHVLPDRADDVLDFIRLDSKEAKQLDAVRPS